MIRILGREIKRMKRLPLEEGYINLSSGIDASVRLLGSYSPAADVTFFPIRRRCPITGEPVETVELSEEGTLYSWSFIHMPKMGSMEADAAGGYGVGQVDLPEGVRVQALIDGRQEDFEIGMRMRLAANVVATDENGTEYCGYKFVPAEVSGEGSAP